MARATREKIKREVEDLNYSMTQPDLRGAYRTLCPTAVEYTFSSSGHAPFSRTDHRLGHKANLSPFKRLK